MYNPSLTFIPSSRNSSQMETPRLTYVQLKNCEKNQLSPFNNSTTCQSKNIIQNNFLMTQINDSQDDSDKQFFKYSNLISQKKINNLTKLKLTENLFHNSMPNQDDNPFKKCSDLSSRHYTPSKQNIEISPMRRKCSQEQAFKEKMKQPQQINAQMRFQEYIQGQIYQQQLKQQQSPTSPQMQQENNKQQTFDKCSQLINDLQQLILIQNNNILALSKGKKLKLDDFKEFLTELQQQIIKQNNQIKKYQSIISINKLYGSEKIEILNQQKIKLEQVNSELNDQSKQLQLSLESTKQENEDLKNKYSHLLSLESENQELKEKYSVLQYNLQDQKSANKSLKDKLNSENENHKIQLKQKQQQVQDYLNNEKQLILLKDQQIQQYKEQIILFQSEKNNQFEGNVKLKFEYYNPQTKYDDSLQPLLEYYQQTSTLQVSNEEKERRQINHREQESLYQKQLVQPSSEFTEEQINSMKGVMIINKCLENSGITTYIAKESFQQLSSNGVKKMEQNIIATGQEEFYQYFRIRYDDPNKFREDYVHYNIFIDQILQKIAKVFNINNTDREDDLEPITILNINIVETLLDFKIFFNESKSQPLDFEAISKSFKEIGLIISSQNMLEGACISCDLFDTIHNRVWKKSQNKKIEFRGQLSIKGKSVPQKYLKPIGYLGLGLKVTNMYGEDKSWLEKNNTPSTWIVLYLCTNSKKKIDQERGIINLYQGEKCRITGNSIKSGAYQNIYLTDDVTIAETFGKNLAQILNNSYSIIFQCRVNPEGVKSPESNPNYYLVSNLKNIRPYRILIKEQKLNSN